MAQFIESKWLSKAKATPWLYKRTSENWRVYEWQRKPLTYSQQRIANNLKGNIDIYNNGFEINNQYRFNKAMEQQIKLRIRYAMEGSGPRF